MQTKTTILTLMLSLMAVLGLDAQTTVKGLLIDKTTGEGEPYATVRITKQGADTPATMFLTAVDGTFSHDVSGSGQFTITFSSVGKSDLVRDITLTGSGTLDLGTLYIEENSTELAGVEIIAQRPLVKMEVDKMTYNVSEDADARASTVLDMLRKVPMVTVDGQDNITVNGSSSFQVYVDGKPNPMFQMNPSMIFKNMPATAVKNIEVVTNPGAKYDAEGATGVLNIVLNHDGMDGGADSMNGYNGSLRASAGTNAWGGGAFLSGQQGRLSYSASAMMNKMTPGQTKVTGVTEQYGDASTMGQTTEARTKTRLPFTMGSLSLSYDLDTLSTLGLTAQLTSMQMKNTGITLSDLVMGGPAGSYGISHSNYGSSIDMKNRQTSFSGSLDYQRFFNSERTSWLALVYQLSYSPTHNKTLTDFTSTDGVPLDLTNRLSDNNERTTEHTLQADLTTPLGTVVGGSPAHTLNIGAKLMMRRATSQADYFLAGTLAPNLSTDYLHKHHIGAAYAEYEGRWGAVSAKAGLRYEHTWQDVEYAGGQGQDFQTDYGNLVPSASLSFSPAPTSNIGLTYNLRISRPGITYLNPYVDRSDPTRLTYGNTDLDVEKTHNVALVYNAFSQRLMLNFNLSHNFTDNAIEQYSFEQDGMLHTTYGNIVRRHRTGLNGFVNWLAAKNTRLFLNGGVSYTDLRSSRLDTRNHGWQANAMVGAQQTLPLELKLSAYLVSSTRSYTLQGWSSGANMLIGNLSRTFFDDKLTLAVMGMTGLSSGGCLKMETKSAGRDFLSHQTIRVPVYGVNFSVQYAFGNTKRQFQQRQTRIQSDYIEQQSQGEVLQGAGSMGN